MNQLKIEELSFCEDAAVDSLVGGALPYSAGYAAQATWDYLSGYLSYYSVPDYKGYSYVVGGYVDGAAAGAIAAGVAVGGVPVATYTVSTIAAVG